MRLRSIHIKGFKSFPLDTAIHFNEKVTGVVGPNGSGKSNIVDAIRWVLGEQKTTELRLGNMADVLFNGTKKRKKSGLAQVTLEFDNTKNLIPTEYHQVSVSRLLFRNGESEYRINEVPCRLKDVRSMFVDTGVGPDSYAIIALNMVDDILTDNNGSRRRMFEQASGISKYKKRKKETLNKLKITSADLDRVEDLLFEIGNNLKELEKQAKRVERYLKIKEQYKEISLQLHLLKADQITESQKELAIQIDQETIQYKSYETTLRSREADLQNQKSLIISSEQALGKFQKDINVLLDDIRKEENQKQLYQQEKGFNRQKSRSIVSEQLDLTESIKVSGELLDKLLLRKHEEQKVHKGIDQRYEDLEKIHRILKLKFETLKTGHDQINLEKTRLEDLKFEMEKGLAVDENQIESTKNLIQRKKDKMSFLEAENIGLKKEKTELLSTVALLGEKLKLQMQSIKSRKDSILELKRKREDLLLKKGVVGRKLDARTNEYDLIKSMIDSFEGFPESIKYLDKNWREDIPLLTDVIYAPDDFKLAIENFLDSYLNYYVVKSVDEAKKALSVLHGAQKGKAYFFILDQLENKKHISQEIAGLEPAIKFLEYDSKFEKLVSRLFRNVFITEHEIRDIELRALMKSGEVFYVLDKKGTFIASNYTISGGSVGLFEGKKLGRRKNLEKLLAQIKEHKKNLVECDSALDQIRNALVLLEREVQRDEDSDLSKKIEKFKIKLLELELNVGSRHKNRTVLLKECENHEAEIVEFKKAIEERRMRIKKAEEDILHLLEGYDHKDNAFQSLSEQLSLASEKKNTQQIELIKHQNLLETLESEIQYKRNEQERSERKFKENEQEIENLAKQLIKIEDSAVELEKKLIEKYELKKSKETNLTDVERAFYEKRGKINELEEAISSIRRNMNQTQFLINELKEKEQDQHFRLQAVQDRLKIEFNIELRTILDLERTDLDLITLEEKHDRLKRKIENFGEVNTLAMEAFYEMKERFDLISKQKEDINLAKESLMRTIGEIEEIARRKYLETFEIVKGHFKNVFTRLFKEGDTCDILMEDPENPLESRIEIIAKPKGKRPKTLNQLSGGEKTLTAIALLFSLYLFKPAPFCIFDEVDAPLDDANIEKFNRIVKDFSGESQFIIITHNKATMAAVDVLYGVFMQEMGVSEVAAVDFRNLEHLITLPVNNNN